MAETDDILVAARSAIYRSKDGDDVRIRKGRTTARRGHAVVRGFEHFWTPLVPTFETAKKARS